MDTPGYIVLSRLVAQQRTTEVLAHNVANADTPGYRAARMVFGEHLARQRDTDVPPGIGRSLALVQDRATWREDRMGPLQRTGNPLDLALSGEGYFAVETPQGERYTRAGRFTLDQDRRVVDMDGHPVLDIAGEPIVLAPGDTRIEVLGDGTLRTENGPVARLRVVRFEDAQQLLAEGSRLFAAGEGAVPEPVELPAVVQGALEGSNVQPVLELTRLTEEMRQFQIIAQFADRENERLQNAVDRILRRRG